MDPILGSGPVPWQKNAGATKPKFKLPDGYTDESEFLSEMRTGFSEDQAFDYDNHVAGVEDMQFLAGDQWDWMVRELRQIKKKPVLTINRLPAFVGQVLGSRKQNETEINIAPDTGGDKQTAQAREDLIRSIWKASRGEGIADKALEGSVSCGIGNFGLDIDYFGDDVWDQEIRLKSYPDHFSVVWDRNRKDPTGRDATRCFVVDSVPYQQFMKTYPWASPANIMDQRMPAELITTGWYEKGDVRIVEYWHMRTRKRVIALFKDGTTQDITDNEDPSAMANVASRSDGSPYIRDVYRPYAQKYLCSGTDILAGPYELPIPRIPVFRVPGWEIQIGDKVHRWGLIRNMKDPQRLHNIWRSAIAERLMLSPKNQWVASAEAVAGREPAWRNAHLSDDPLLVYNGAAGTPPQRNAPIQVEQALIMQAEMTVEDMKDVSNIHEANLGMPSNEVSAVAIRARQSVSDTGTILYHQNLANAIEECGRTIDALLPVVYDTPRMVKVIGKDAKQYMLAINDIAEGAVDITRGKYSVTVITGPTFETKRQQTAESMLSLAQSMPEVFSVAPDILVQALDWPMSDELAARLKRALPPGLLTPDEMTPDLQARAVGAAQQAQQQNALATAKVQADSMAQQAMTAMNLSRAQNYAAQAQSIAPKLQNQSLSVASEAASRELHDSLAAISLAHGH